MTRKHAMKTADALRPNALPEEQKAQWLHEIEGRWALARGEQPPDNPWPEDGHLCAPEPWGGFYTLYLCARIDFALQETTLYANDMAMFNAAFADAGGSVWLADAGRDDPDVTWTAQFVPTRETEGGGLTLGKKQYAGVKLRLELPPGSWLRAEVRCDGGNWEQAGSAAGYGAGVVSLPLRLRRCDCFELRLTGRGPCGVLGVARTFRLGSEV